MLTVAPSPKSGADEASDRSHQAIERDYFTFGLRMSRHLRFSHCLLTGGPAAAVYETINN